MWPRLAATSTMTSDTAVPSAEVASKSLWVSRAARRCLSVADRCPPGCRRWFGAPPGATAGRRRTGKSWGARAAGPPAAAAGARPPAAQAPRAALNAPPPLPLCTGGRPAAMDG